ncbi:hypothetical protein [Methanobacterium paludis]|uniref:Uncharacterized protein n=1 Tax=Methanobacterium paludis (strain DSM 25820 / JCM 18151 / SWAN1) TaxID=868131 RepID=F6D627_METPW|nr:hypothetical protein [Methanobacterium paludis]AEG17675.1 hypothetical protein MSWAN_0639 [Methanobacterium paludis]
MDNKEIRMKILEVLYDQEMEKSRPMPHGILKKELAIESNKVDLNVKYLERKGYIDLITAMNYYAANITATGIDYIENNEEVPKQNITHVNVNGNVENLALGDINTYNTSIYLNALIKAIEKAEEISPEEKKNLIDKIKDVAKNPYVSSISSSLIVESIKVLLTSFKPF